MPRLRTSLVLAAVALALLGFILWFERGTPSTGELEQRKDNALPGFVRDRIDKLEIQRAGQVTVLTRASGGDETAEARWQVEAPYRAEADREAVDSLLGDLEFMTVRRRIEQISAADRERFGFDRPRFRVWFSTGAKRTRLLVGNESPRGDGLYVEGAPGTAFIVDQRLAQTLNQEPGAYHSKTFFTDLHPDRIDALTVRDETGERLLRQVKQRWSLATPPLGLASADAVGEMIRGLDGLRAKHFVAQRATDAERAQYGLTDARLLITIQQRAPSHPKDTAGASAPPPGPALLRLAVGQPCPAYTGESYATVGEAGAVMCVADADLAKLHPSAADLREPRLLPFETEDGIRSVQVQRGDAQLVLRKTESGWSYDVSRAGQSLSQGEARGGAVSDWLEKLRGSRVLRWQAGTLHPPSGESITLRVEHGDVQPAYQIELDTSASELLARRVGEPDLAVLPATVRELLVPSAAAFRALELAKIPESALRQLEIRRGGQLERITRTSDGKQFAIVAPLQAPADGARMGELTRLLGALEAVRFVADTPAELHGLTTPQSQLSVEYEITGKDAPRQRLGLRVGAATDGGRFAQLEGQPGVFVIPAQLADLLAEPLISRTALSSPFETLASVELSHAGRALRIIRRGAEFASEGASTTDSAVVRGVVETLATLRASRADHYGQASDAEGMNRAAARITVRLLPGAAVEGYEILLGAEAPGGGRFARRSDMGVGFVVPATSADALLAPLKP